ncbi:uncharacterized protein CANTADRAFT_43891 [Suhomyces tanzawaensis NRRL Y-17324]|uniref:CUE domain-containing protein n=1 Tax=Suhomyces tanzawaensis NRRL Y-17324 TaxID=984487 RepID=A0A1E4SPV5_9ASCO|nr:uncharacterized protein CANTADRAFT_43891 [Suhomyces tanzawaensis NRRL Y-17324]ODV81442.1 hypothetical protein CANTADRAFT_43891 [Suhomyces tanzawaensis NRRL Y-17324]
MVNGKTISDILTQKGVPTIIANPNYESPPDTSVNEGSLKNRASTEDNHYNATFFLNDEDYTRFVYDELDEDEDFLDLVDKLADLFPTYRRTELKIRVKLSEDIDVLVEELFLEQETNELVEAVRAEESSIIVEQQKPVYSPAVYQLKDIFPTIDNDTLKFALDEAHGDLQIATDNLLTGTVSSFKPAEPVTGSVWGSIQETASKLSSITEIPLSDATSFLHARNGNFIESLIAVVLTYTRNPLVASTAPREQIPRGGRVQRGGAKIAGRVGNGTPVPVPVPSQSYRFSPQSGEYQELLALLRSNAQFRGIGMRFCEKALVLFNGNPFKVIDICRMVVEYNCEHLTKKKSVPVVPKALVLGVKMAPPENPNLSNQFARFRTKSRVINEPERQTQSERLAGFQRTGEIDLHGLKVTTAILVTQKALISWWSKEISAREYEGNLRRYGSKAVFEGPARIITGRGLHSVGGIPVIKMGIKNYLTKNRYVYEELVGSYVVLGKRN